MPINAEELVLMARDMVTELPESVTLSRESLYTLIRPAIALWQEQTNDDLQKRQNFIVQSGDITITAGKADIDDAIDEFGFRLEFIKESDIIITHSKPPFLSVKFVNSMDRLILTGRQDKFFVMAHLLGSSIFFKDAGATAINTLGGTFKIRSAVIPVDLNEMNSTIMPEIALVLASLAGKQWRDQNRGLNVPPKQ